MSLTIAVAKETAASERRVAATPETVRKLAAMGCAVTIQQGSGDGSSFPDAAYADAGATLVPTGDDAVRAADIVLCVQTPAENILSAMRPGALLIGALNPYRNADLPRRAAAGNINALAMELMPRITRAQAMDILSSQANLAGYKAVLDACEQFTRAFPMMMTAAGTVPPARVMVMGVGVAGLQAIATAKRLGAIVSATDVRPAVKEQVASLGGTFVAVEDEEFKQAETAGGYAKQMSPEYQAKQQALIEETLPKQDIVITTALIPGRAAPVLVTRKMVESMKPGSVIVDLAVEQGGNCELSQAGEIVLHNGVSIVGHLNVPSRLAATASSLYAKNLLNLLGLMIKDSSLSINWDDEIVRGVALTRDGAVIHPNFGGAQAA